MAALKIGERLRFEVDRNRVLTKSATLPAIERYTGVVFDPIDAAGLGRDSRAWAAEHVAIHSALFGLVGALDPIPAYRLSHDSRLPDLPLRAHWADAVRRALVARATPVIDLRSEAYVELGPAPADSAYVRVVSDSGGRRRALNHFNKKTKGTVMARLLAERPDLVSIGDFVEWARGQGMTIEPNGGELLLVSESVLHD